MRMLGVRACLLLLAPCALGYVADIKLSCVNGMCVIKPAFVDFCCVNQLAPCKDSSECSFIKTCLLPPFVCNFPLDNGTEYSPFSQGARNAYIEVPEVKVTNVFDWLKDFFKKLSG